MNILNPGSQEPLKAAVHAAAFALMAICCGYNALAWQRRRQRHLWVNALAYGALAAWEGVHVAHHRESAVGCKRR